MMMNQTFTNEKTWFEKSPNIHPFFQNCWTLEFQIHPGRLTWNLRIHPWKRKNIFQKIIFRFYVDLWGIFQWSGSEQPITFERCLPFLTIRLQANGRPSSPYRGMFLADFFWRQGIILCDFFWNHGNRVDFFLNSFVLRETKAICCQIVAFHPDPASSWKIRCSFKFRIQKVTSVRWFLTSTCVFSDFGDANDWLIPRGSFKPALNLIRSISMIFVHQAPIKMGQNDPFKWSLRFLPNLVSLHLRYVPPQPGQLRPLETIDHHGHGLASGWNPEFQDRITGSVVEACQNNCCIHQSKIWSPLETFFWWFLGGNGEQYNPTYMYIFFIFHFSLKQYLYSFGVTKNPHDASAPTNRSKKELTPVILSSETHLRWVSRYLLMASSLRLMPKHHVGVTKKIWSCL